MGLLKGRDMIVEACNAALLEIWEKDSSIIGKPLLEVIPHLQHFEYIGLLRQVFDTGIPFAGKGYRATVQRGGRDTYLDFTYTPFRNEHGTITGVIVMADDVTDHYHAQQRVIEAEGALREAAELAGLATWSIDPATGAIWYSDRMKGWIGAPEDERDFDEGMNPVPESDRERVRMALQRAMLPEGGGIYDLEHPIMNIVTGQERIIHARAHITFDDNGKALKMMGTAQDVTTQRNIRLALEHQVQQRTEELDAANEELKAINEELHATNDDLASMNGELGVLNADLLQSNDALQQFAHVASHDLKEPLRKIKTFLNRIEADKDTVISANSKTFLTRVYMAADRMFAMISGVLAYSTINASEQTIQQVDLKDIVHHLEDDLEVLIVQKQAAIHSGDLPVIEGAAVLLHQLFYNLVINALKFSRADVPPVINIRSTNVAVNNQAFVQITVQDNGIGFDPQQAERIFNTFTRLNSKDKYEGTGLGLSLCRKIVTRHGGTITAEGERGKGSMFTVLLPVTQPRETI